jgi:hypothetical protein
VLFCTASSFASDWKTYFKSPDITIEYKYSDCNDVENGIHQEKILLRFINMQEKAVVLFYNKVLIYSATNSSAPDVKTFSITLKSGETKEGDCTTKDNSLFIFSKQLNFSSTELKKFELKDIKVKTIQ